MGMPQSNHPKVGHGRHAQLALETCLEGSHAEVELSGQADRRPRLSGSLLDELDGPFDHPAGCPPGEPDGRFAVVVRLSQQQPVEDKTLEMATGDLARGQPRGLIELLSHQIQHRLQSPGGVDGSQTEVEAQL